MAKEFLRNSLARNFLEIPWEFLGPQIPFLEVSLTKDHDFNKFLKSQDFPLFLRHGDRGHRWQLGWFDWIASTLHFVKIAIVEMRSMISSPNHSHQNTHCALLAPKERSAQTNASGNLEKQAQQPHVHATSQSKHRISLGVTPSDYIRSWRDRCSSVLVIESGDNTNELFGRGKGDERDHLRPSESGSRILEIWYVTLP